MPEQPRDRQPDEETPIFDRQAEVYKESYQQRGLDEAEAREKAAEKLETGSGEPGGAHADR